MSFYTIEYQLATLFIIIAFGFVARKIGIMTMEGDTMLSRLIISITLPCTILASVATRNSLPEPSVIANIFLYSCLTFAIVLLLAFIISHLLELTPITRGTYQFMLTFGNTGFLGYPILDAVFGQEAVLYGVIFNIPFHLLVFTVGILMLSQTDASLRQQLKQSSKNLLNPSLAACVITFALALLGITSFGILGETIDIVGAMTTPAALLILGSSLAASPIKEMLCDVQIYLMAAIRLIATPLLIWLLLKPFIDDTLLLGVLVIVSAMPVATNGTMLCLRYGGDLTTITRGTFITTVLSLLTIPLIALLVI